MLNRLFDLNYKNDISFERLSKEQLKMFRYEHIC